MWKVGKNKGKSEVTSMPFSCLAVVLVAAVLPVAHAATPIAAKAVSVKVDMNQTKSIANMVAPSGPMKASDSEDGTAMLSYFFRFPNCGGDADLSERVPEGVCLRAVDSNGNPAGSVKVECSSPTGTWTYREWEFDSTCFEQSSLSFSGKHLECDTKQITVPNYGSVPVGMSVDCGGGSEESAAGRLTSSLALVAVVGIAFVR
jgi:hypothetical protein